LVFSALAARAGAEAAADGDSPSRWSFRALTGIGRDDGAAAAAAAADAGASPTTGAPLEHTHLTPNHLVKSMIAEYQESKG
jgi:hypothetical protein